ncbi:hypothetical protein GCM10022221_67850 [Actinocorallia aurea]
MTDDHQDRELRSEDLAAMFAALPKGTRVRIEVPDPDNEKALYGTFAVTGGGYGWSTWDGWKVSDAEDGVYGVQCRETSFEDIAQMPTDLEPTTSAERTQFPPPARTKGKAFVSVAERLDVAEPGGGERVREPMQSLWEAAQRVTWAMEPLPLGAFDRLGPSLHEALENLTAARVEVAPGYTSARECETFLAAVYKVMDVTARNAAVVFNFHGPVDAGSEWDRPLLALQQELIMLAARMDTLNRAVYFAERKLRLSAEQP